MTIVGGCKGPCQEYRSFPHRMFNQCKYVLKRASFGSKDCTKELKLECAYFLGQTS